MNFKVFFNKSNIEKDKYLSRVFGIFSEDIVRIWCENPKSNYIDLGRPTIYADAWHYTLDFTFKDEQTKRVYLVEMKSEIQYQNYKFMTLTNDHKPDYYLSHHLKKKAFQLFINQGNNPIKINYIDKNKEKNKDDDLKNLNGSILIWGSLAENFNLQIFNSKVPENFHDILSVEDMINDLIKWKDKEYIDFIKKYKLWSNDMFDQLFEK